MESRTLGRKAYSRVTNLADGWNPTYESLHALHWAAGCRVRTHSPGGGTQLKLQSTGRYQVRRACEKYLAVEIDLTCQIVNRNLRKFNEEMTRLLVPTLDSLQ